MTKECKMKLDDTDCAVANNSSFQLYNCNILLHISCELLQSRTDPHPSISHTLRHTVLSLSVFSLTFLHISSQQTPVSLRRRVSLQAPCQFHLSIKMLWEMIGCHVSSRACLVSEADTPQSLQFEMQWKWKLVFVP